MMIGSNHRMGKGSSRRAAASGGRLDYSLIHDVQRRASGANIHAIAQQLQIYVSATECGSLPSAQAAEVRLRSFLVA